MMGSTAVDVVVAFMSARYYRSISVVRKRIPAGSRLLDFPHYNFMNT